MSYNQYNQGGYNQQPGYGQYNPYGQSGNPYGQPQGNTYEQPQQSYGHTGNYSERPDLEHHSSSRYDEESAQPGSYEMSNMNGRDPNRILNEVRNLDRAIDETERAMNALKTRRNAYAVSGEVNKEQSAELELQSNNIMENFRAFLNRVKLIKRDSEWASPRNKPHVQKVERRIKTVMNTYQNEDREYRQETIRSLERQYRIVRPDASDAEVREAAEASVNEPVFSQALLSSNRRGDAQNVRNTVDQRHRDIKHIEQQMMALAELFNDLEALVQQQEPAVAQIEEKGQEAAGHVAQANTELDTAVKSARAARKKKWMCLGIVLLIIIIIVVVVVVVVEVTKK